MRRSMAVSMALVAFLLLTVLAGPGHGSGSQDEAKALVDKAVAFVKSSGAEKGLEEFNKPKSQFVKGARALCRWGQETTSVPPSPGTSAGARGALKGRSWVVGRWP